MSMERYEYFLRAKAVQRFHTVPLSAPQSIAAHSFGVAMYGTMITRGECSAEFMKSALLHDLGEYATGDMPGPYKRVLSQEFPAAVTFLESSEMTAINILEVGNQRLSVEEFALLKLCDAIDGLATCLSEVRSGNRSVVKALVNFIAYADAVDVVALRYSWKMEATALKNYLAVESGPFVNTLAPWEVV